MTKVGSGEEAPGDQPETASRPNFESIVREVDPTIDIRELNRIQLRIGEEAVDLIERAYQAGLTGRTEGDHDE